MSEGKNPRVKIGRLLAKWRKRLHVKQAEIGEELNIAQGMVSRYEAGLVPSDDELLIRWRDLIVRKTIELVGMGRLYGQEQSMEDEMMDFKTEFDHLRSKLIEYKESTNPSEKAFKNTTKGNLLIPEFNVTASAGHGEHTGFEEVVEYHELPQKFLPTMEGKITPGIIRIRGDSMYPTINSGDYVCVNLQNQYYEDGIYLVRIENSVYCKRLQLSFGKLKIISDNPLYREMEIDAEDSDCFEVLGKVILTLKKH